jgi:hypothetical protein
MTDEKCRGESAMAIRETLAKGIRQKLTRRKGITKENMFGVGFLLDGNLHLGV